jgi:hypothetical protein
MKAYAGTVISAISDKSSHRQAKRSGCHSAGCTKGCATAGGRVGMGMKLQQGQLWKTHDTTLRITKLERLAVEYKTLSLPDPETGRSLEGNFIRLTKKEFCRLIKGAALNPPPA